MVNRRKLTDEIKKKLRDPIWQSIGVFLALIAFLTPLIITSYLTQPTPQSSNRIMFTPQTSKYLTDFMESVGKQLTFFIDGKEARDLRLFVFLIEYKGKEPVRSADFERPIRGRIPSNRKIISVQKAANLEGPLRFNREKGSINHETRPPISFDVEILDEQAFQIKPVLMNPGEWLGIEIYTAATNDTNPSTPVNPSERYKLLTSEISWSCHVAGIQCPGSWDRATDFDYLELDEPAFLKVYINHQGWGVYSILLFTIASLLLQVLLAKAAGMQKASPIIQIFLFSVAIALSMASAEVAADWLFTYRLAFGVYVHRDQPIYAYVIFWLNISVIVILTVLSIRKRKNKRTWTRRPVKPTEEEI